MHTNIAKKQTHKKKEQNQRTLALRLAVKLFKDASIAPNTAISVSLSLTLAFSHSSSSLLTLSNSICSCSFSRFSSSATGFWRETSSCAFVWSIVLLNFVFESCKVLMVERRSSNACFCVFSDASSFLWIMCACVCVLLYSCVNVCVCVLLYSCVNVCVCVLLYSCVNVCVFLLLCSYVYVCVCLLAPSE